MLPFSGFTLCSFLLHLRSDSWCAVLNDCGDKCSDTFLFIFFQCVLSLLSRLDNLACRYFHRTFLLNGSKDRSVFKLPLPIHKSPIEPQICQRLEIKAVSYFRGLQGRAEMGVSETVDV